MFENINYDLSRISYGRRGTYFYLGLWEEDGKNILYACALYSGMDSAAPGQKARCGKLFPIILERNGKEISYTASATPVCVTLDFDGGKARLCLQQGGILRMEAIGADIVLSPDLSSHEIAKDRNDGSWEVIMQPVPKLLFYPLQGKMEVSTGFDVINSIPEKTVFRFTASEDNRIDLAIHLYLSNSWRLQQYPSFDDCMNSIETEFSAYLDTVPSLPEEFSKARIIEAFIVWSHIIPVADGTQIIFMNKGIHRFTSSWQQCYHAMGQYNNPKFAWELLLSVFKYQDDYGMLPDCIYDTYQSYSGCKPPLHGVALEFLKEYSSFDFLNEAEYLKLYKGLSDLVYWWLSFRDTDNDGIAQYDSADESGWDDSSFFIQGYPVEAPDLATYLILAMDNLADIAGKLGRSYEQCEWKNRSDTMLTKMLSFFWNGKQFAGRRNGSHEWINSSSVTTFIPLLLGNRLPKEIIDTMADALAQEDVWLTPYGLAGESLSSSHFHESGWSAGPVLAPIQLLIVLGLRACGKDAQAKDISLRYCRALNNAGFPMVLNARNGKDVSEGRWSTRYPNRMAWTAMVFLLLGSLYNE